jgi:ATP-dependent phosphoenolpyruvate carboxykinase
MDTLEYVPCTAHSSYRLTDLFRQWDPRYRIKVRVICARAYHALFMVRHITQSNLQR